MRRVATCTLLPDMYTFFARRKPPEQSGFIQDFSIKNRNRKIKIPQFLIIYIFERNNSKNSLSFLRPVMMFSKGQYLDQVLSTPQGVNRSVLTLYDPNFTKHSPKPSIIPMYMLHMKSKFLLFRSLNYFVNVKSLQHYHIMAAFY